MTSNDTSGSAGSTTMPTQREATVLLARTGISALPRAELTVLAERVSDETGADARYAFTEQGEPSLRSVLFDLRGSGVTTISIIPLAFPVEPNLSTWIHRVVRRWQRESGNDWPEIRVGGGLVADRLDLQALVVELAREGSCGVPVVYKANEKPEGSIVPAQKRRVLVCHGAPCNNAGAGVIWGHLRNEQQRLDLRNTGVGVATAKTSCLGPCGLAPVVQVFPDGTYYGGVDEEAVDRIIADDLMGGRVVKSYAYVPTGKKQRLRVTR